MRSHSSINDETLYRCNDDINDDAEYDDDDDLNFEQRVELLDKVTLTN